MATVEIENLPAGALKPSEEIVKKSSAPSVVTDSLGRVLVTRKVRILDQLRLVEALGPETSRNTTYVSMCLPVIGLLSIDGEDVIPPTTKLEIEALFDRLGDEGVDCLTEAYLRANGYFDNALVKGLPGTPGSGNVSTS